MNKVTTIILALAAGLLLGALPSGAAPVGELSGPPGQTQLAAGTLPAGVYEATFRLQVNRLEQSVTPLATLNVNVPGYPQAALKQITPLSFTAANTPTDFVVRFDNFAAQNVDLWADVKKVDASAPQLTVEKLSLRPLPGVGLGVVWPGKIMYKRQEDAQGLVAVYNGTAQPQAVTLRLALESDLQRRRSLGDVPVKLAPGERREVPVKWNTGAEQWGFALVATLADAAGKTLDEGREYFSVSDNMWAVGITQQQRGSNVPNGPGPNPSSPVSQIQQAEDQLAAVLAKPQPPVYWNYTNYAEYYAWAPEDFFNLAPSTDHWYSGTGNYTMSKRHLQLAIQYLHRRGMRAETYTNPFVIGYGSEKIFEKHPEWFAYQADGQLALSSYYEKKLEIGEHLTTEGPWGLQLSPYALLTNINASRLDVIEQHVQQLVKSHYMFGWDGVRFDNAVYPAFGYDWQGHKIDGGSPARKDQIEAQAWRYLRQRLQQELGPIFAVGTNDDYEFRGRNPGAWDEVCKNGGLLMEEVPRSSYSPLSVNNRWVDYIARYHEAGEAVRALGGHHLTIGFDMKYPVDHLYSNVLTYVDRTHPYANINSDDLPLGNYAAFITRYSALYWDVEHVKLLPDAEQRVKVAASGPVWWKDYACVRQTPEGKRQYLINLVNPPAQERIYSDPTNKVRAPLQNVAVSLTLQAGDQITAAYLLSADPTMTRTALPLTRAGNAVSVTVPTVWFWSLVVFE
ncbi:MAG TPA: glycoside hydrolase family 66 protein [Armatimonadota bacterium]